MKREEIEEIVRGMLLTNNFLMSERTDVLIRNLKRELGLPIENMSAVGGYSSSSGIIGSKLTSYSANEIEAMRLCVEACRQFMKDVDEVRNRSIMFDHDFSLGVRMSTKKMVEALQAVDEARGKKRE